MTKYLRKVAEGIVPPHRYVSYVHFLDMNEPTSEDEYINRLCMQRVKYKTTPFNAEDEAEALEAL